MPNDGEGSSSASSALRSSSVRPLISKGIPATSTPVQLRLGTSSSITPGANRHILDHAPKYTPSVRSSGSSAGMSPTPSKQASSTGRPARRSITESWNPSSSRPSLPRQGIVDVTSRPHSGYSVGNGPPTPPSGSAGSSSEAVLPSSANDPRLRRTPSAGDKRLRTPSSTSPDRLTKRSRPSYQSVDVIDLTIGHTSLNGVIDLSLDSDDDMSDIIEVCAPPVSEIVHRPRPRPPKPADLIKAPRTAQKELPTTGTPKTAVIQANDKSASSLPKPVPILDRVEGRISDVCLDSVVHGTPHDEFTTQSRPVVPILGGFQHDSISSKPNRASFDHTVETTAPSILGAAGDNGSFDIPATVSAVRPALSYPPRSPSLTPALPAVKQSPPSTNHRRGIFSFDARSRPEVAGMKRTVLRLIETIYPQPSLDIERNRSVVTPSWPSADSAEATSLPSPQTHTPRFLQRNVRVGGIGLCSQRDLPGERFERHRIRLAAYEQRLSSLPRRTHFDFHTNEDDQIRIREKSGRTGLDELYIWRARAELQVENGRLPRTLVVMFGKMRVVEWPSKGPSSVIPALFPSSITKPHSVISSGTLLHTEQRDGHVRLNFTSPEPGEAQGLVVHLFDPIAGMAWSSGRDPSAPILYWISEEIKLVSPRGWSLPTQPIYFRAPSRWSGTHHELAIVGGIEVAWGYDYHVPMASLRIRPRSTELTPMVKITYILGRNHCAVVKAGERERIVLGWRCAFCSLDELGGEEELLLHYSLAHREDCEVEILEPRETVGDILHLFIRLRIHPDPQSAAEAKPIKYPLLPTPQPEPPECLSSDGKINKALPSAANIASSEDDTANDGNGSHHKAVAELHDLFMDDTPSPDNGRRAPTTRASAENDIGMFTETYEEAESDKSAADIPEVPVLLTGEAAVTNAARDFPDLNLSKEEPVSIGAGQGDEPLQHRAVLADDELSTDHQPPLLPETSSSILPFEPKLSHAEPSSQAAHAASSSLSISAASASTEQLASSDALPAAGPSRLPDRSDIQARYPEGAYPNPLKVAAPQMFGRANKWTEWSTRVNPGTLADLMPELDNIYDGGEFRHVMRDQEESNIWMWHHLTDKRKFVACCWGRWRHERGPMATIGQSEYLKTWVDKYGAIMRRADCELEFKDQVYIVFHHRLITRRLLIQTCAYWDRLRNDEMRSRGEPVSDDDTEL